MIPKGWELNNFGLKVTNTDYPTTFGDPRVTADNSYKFSRVTAEIELQRSGIRIFISAFLGLFVATILVIITFAINSTKVGLTTIPQQAQNHLVRRRHYLRQLAVLTACPRKFLIPPFLLCQTHCRLPLSLLLP